MLNYDFVKQDSTSIIHVLFQHVGESRLRDRLSQSTAVIGVSGVNSVLSKLAATSEDFPVFDYHVFDEFAIDAHQYALESILGSATPTDSDAAYASLCAALAIGGWKCDLYSDYFVLDCIPVFVHGLSALEPTYLSSAIRYFAWCKSASHSGADELVALRMGMWMLINLYGTCVIDEIKSRTPCAQKGLEGIIDAIAESFGLPSRTVPLWKACVGSIATRVSERHAFSDE